MTLNAVVLPAPFGPISPTISPSRASNETRSSATTPPKRRVTFSTERSAIGGITLKRDEIGYELVDRPMQTGAQALPAHPESGTASGALGGRWRCTKRRR